MHACPIFLSDYIRLRQMAKITYIEHSGKSHTIDIKNGLTVMEGAVQNDIPVSYTHLTLPTNREV